MAEYVALRQIKTKNGLIKPGESVCVEGWHHTVVSAHLRMNMMAAKATSPIPVAKIALKVPGRIIKPGEPVPEFAKWGEAVKRNHLNFGWVEFPTEKVVESKAPAPVAVNAKAKKKSKKKKGAPNGVDVQRQPRVEP